ncbi:vWA domain-containing protein [Robiginitalea marina]|uniref:VWA domain-containing protein n=1 Tax=Robiginitalea marina TaxID=2954105 RepID=A0ABT1AUD4_9FLAO|nr:vWA domain-containing protein [Robiginitalea marina]MCO5723572.1 VWA domain-containing protein [Robiginitalea marina]
MGHKEVLWIALGIALAFLGAGLQYFYRAGAMPNRWLLAFLRFLALFGVFLLLFPLQLEQTDAYAEKQQLLLLFDNSRSAGREPARSQVLEAARAFSDDRDLKDRFQVQAFSFGTGLQPGDSLDFSEKGTDISGALEALAGLEADRKATIVLVTDGVENLGKSLAVNPGSGVPVFPVIVGDTATYSDLRIDRINLNRYAFLGNQFPIEVLVSFRGQGSASTVLQIFDNGAQIHRETLTFGEGKTSLRTAIQARAGETGLHTIRVVLSPLEGERNTGNNSKMAGLEVVDETTRISLVSSHPHPDIGALTRTIEENKQRQVRVVSPREALEIAGETDLWILYQPDASFRGVYSELARAKAPLITIAGDLTDWGFLNRAQATVQLEEQGPSEDLLPAPNPSFSLFDVSEWEVSGYPPLNGFLGEYRIGPAHEWLLGQRVRGVSLDQPLLALVNGSEPREAFLAGSGLWRWRMHVFARDGNFRDFDALWGKVFLFLTAGAQNDRLRLEYQNVYDGLQPAVIRARYFDEAFRFDPEATLNLTLRDSANSGQRTYPMSLGKGYFEADLSDLPTGAYAFSVEEAKTGALKSGQFRLQDFDLEGQLVSSDLRGLSRLAQGSGGAVYFPAELNSLKDSLLESERFRPVQRTRRNIVSLIDFRWLLAAIVAALSAEWFIRKYNGLL